MTKINKIKSIFISLVMMIALFFGISSLNLNANVKDKKTYADSTSFSLYLEGVNEYTTTKTGAVSYKLKLNNPNSDPIWAVSCEIHYDSTCLKFENGSTSISGWAGSISYQTEGYINIPLTGGAFSDQIYDKEITVATLNFKVNTPSAKTYPFTFESIKVGGVNMSTGKKITHNVTGDTFNLTFREPNTDASLKNGISVKAAGSEVGSYNAGTKTYTATVPFKTISVAVSATPNDSNATISGTGNWSLQAGKENTKTITVTAEDGRTTQTYTVNITREAGKTDSSLASLVLKDSSNKEITLTRNDKTFTATIDSTNMTGLSLTATANDTDATVAINDKNQTSCALNLSVGPNTIKVKVTAQDGTATEYSLVITVNYISGTDASIKSLSVKAGGSEVGSYDAASRTYTGSVESSVTSVEISVQTNDAKAKVEGAGTWTLVTGENKKDITVTAEDGVTKVTYTIKINKASQSGGDPEPDNPNPVNPDDPNYLEIMRYIKFGGDINLTITKYDFLDLSSDSLLATVKTSKDKISFYLDFSSDITVSAVYGTEDSGEIRTLTNGYKRICFNSKQIKGDDFILLKITDNDSETTRTYIIKIVEDDGNISSILQISLMVVIAVEIILIIIIFIEIKKIKNSIKQGK